MGLTLEQVVPWGRSLAEYRQMFNLLASDLQSRILDCGGGPASFNAEMTQQGHAVVSCDPVYQFGVAEIERQIEATYAVILQQVEANQHCYIWQTIASPQQLGAIRMAAMRRFLADFPQGRSQQRYVTDALPVLSFADRQFDLALCSHLLFTYSDHRSLAFHLDSIRELCRVATDVRIFPLLKLDGEPSPFVQPVMQALNSEGYRVQIQSVAYEFQKGGDRLLRVQFPMTG